jgi:hypothetical protein
MYFTICLILPGKGQDIFAPAKKRQSLWTAFAIYFQRCISISASVITISSATTISAASAAVVPSAVSTAAAAAAIESSSTASAVESTAATAAAILGLLYDKGFFTEGDFIQVFDGIAAIRVFNHFHEPESFALACFPVHDNLR